MNSAPIDRNNIINQINYCKTLNTQGNYQDSFAQSSPLISKIMDLNFSPLLTTILTEHLFAALKLSKFSSICSDYFMLLSPKLRPQKPENTFTKLNNFIDSQSDLLISFEGLQTFFFPIDIDISYNQYNVVAGNKPTILISFLSHLPQSIEISNFSLVFTHEGKSSNEEEILKIQQKFELSPKLTKRISIERNLPHSISKERIVAIIIQIKKIFVRLSIRNKVINVIPDEKACKVEGKIPKICIISTDLPFSVTLTADNQKIEKLNVLFTTENPMIPLTITGTYNNTNIEIGKTINLPDIEPKQSIVLNLLVHTLTPIFNPVIFKYSFGTSISGIGKFQKTFSFDFQSPFIANLQLYDENYMIIPPNEPPAIEEGKNVYVEASLQNNIKIPIKILKINPSSFFEDDSESKPFDILPFEKYTFIGEISTAGLYDINVEYQTEEIEKAVFTMKMPSIVNANRNFSIDIDCPSGSPIFKEFEMKLKFNRNGYSDNDNPEVCQVSILIIPSDNFFIQGPLETKNLYLFKNQSKELSLKLVPLLTGSILLPQIVITDHSYSPPKSKKIIKSIVINYQ